MNCVANLKREGVRCFGPKKEEYYYFKEGGHIITFKLLNESKLQTAIPRIIHSQIVQALSSTKGLSFPTL